MVEVSELCGFGVPFWGRVVSTPCVYGVCSKNGPPNSKVEVANTPNSQVYRTMFYMGRFGKNTPKRHILWSNNSGLLDQVFQKAGYMSRAEQAALKDSLVKPYTDKNGQRRFVGIKSKLKDSQRLV